MSVQKRVRNGATMYVVRWYAADGKERAKGGFRTRKAAEDYAAIDVEPKRRRGIDIDPRAGSCLFRESAQAWLRSRKSDLKITTWGGYEYALAPAAQRQGDGKTLGIDAVFGGYPLNRISREYIQSWVQQMTDAGKKPSTVRHAFFTVRMILGQALVDNKIATNPADHVKLPTDTSNPGVVDDPDMFLTAAQVSALTDATPWPYYVMVNLAAWSGLRAAELGGLQVGDIDLPAARNKDGSIRVERTARIVGTQMEYLEPKTKGSRRRVPLPRQSTELLRGYLAEHPRGDNPTAPLFPAMSLAPVRPTGIRNKDTRPPAERQTQALAELSVKDAAARLILDWAEPLRHPTFYKAVYRPAVLRANQDVTAHRDRSAALPPALTFHALRHTYASLCIAAGIKPEKLSRRMGHSKITTTLSVYVHLFPDDDASADMAALDAMSMELGYGPNVVTLRDRCGS